MKQVIVIFMVILFCSDCKKKDAEGDLSGKEYIRGRLFLTDLLTQHAQSVPLGKKKVYIGYKASTDTLNFLFTTTTDDDGYFIFFNLKEGTEYRLYYEESINGIINQAVATTKAPVDTIRLIANVSETLQNGIHFTVSDINGGLLNGANLCIFNSALAIGYSANTCEGSNYKLTSDSYGHASKFSLPQGTYYINSTIEIGGIPWFSKDTVTIADKVNFDTIKLKVTPGIHFTVSDLNGGLLSGATLCIFNSPIATGYSTNSCEGSNYKLTSDTKGNASKYSVPPGTYYINSTLEIGGIPWFAKDTVTVTDAVNFDTIKLKLPNGFKITVLDSLGTRVNGASICIFNSLALYRQDTCEGNNFQLISNLNGEASKYNLVPNTYYIYSSYQTPSKTIWVARDTLNVTNQILQHNLILRKKY